MQSISLVPSTAYDSSLYVAGIKSCPNGLIILEDRVTQYFMSITDTTSVSIDTHLLHQTPNSGIQFTLIVNSVGDNVLNLSGFNVDQVQVLSGESQFTVMKGLGDYTWSFQMKSTKYRPEMWLKCYNRPALPEFNTGVFNYFNLYHSDSSTVNYSIFSNAAPGAITSTEFGPFNRSTNGYICAKFPMPVWLNTVSTSIRNGATNLNYYPISLLVYGSNDGVEWNQILNTSLNHDAYSVGTYTCQTTNYYTFFKFKFFLDETIANRYYFPAIALSGFCSELISPGAYVQAPLYAPSLPINGYNIESNASAMSSVSGDIVKLTQFYNYTGSSYTYAMTRASGSDIPWEYIFTFPEAIRTIGFIYKSDSHTFKLFALSYSDDKETWTEYCKVDGTIEAWNAGLDSYQTGTYFCDSRSEHRYYKISVYSVLGSTGIMSNYLSLYGLTFLQFQKGHYYSFESFIPKLSADSQDGYVLTASDSSIGPAWKMFDRTSNYGGGNISNGEWSLLIELPEATVVRGLSLTSPSSSSYYTKMPNAFSLLGSNDNDTWTTLKSFFLGNSYWNSPYPKTAQWDIENNTAYKYYKLVVTSLQSGTSVYIGEMGLCSYASFKGINYDEYLVPIMSADNQDGYTAICSSTSSSSYPAYKAFDRNTSTYWASNSNLGNWIGIQLPQATKADVFIVSSAASQKDYAPKNFDIQGSNDGETWNNILSVSDAGWSSGSSAETKTYSIDEPVEYSYYRLYINSNYYYNQSRVGMFNVMMRITD